MNPFMPKRIELGSCNIDWIIQPTIMNKFKTIVKFHHWFKIYKDETLKVGKAVEGDAGGCRGCSYHGEDMLPTGLILNCPERLN